MNVKNFIMCAGWFVAGIAVVGMAPSEPDGFTVKPMHIDPAYRIFDKPSIPSSWRLVGVAPYGGMVVLWFQDAGGNCFAVHTSYDNGEIFIRSPNVSKLEAK